MLRAQELCLDCRSCCAPTNPSLMLKLRHSQPTDMIVLQLSGRLLQLNVCVWGAAVRAVTQRAVQNLIVRLG